MTERLTLEGLTCLVTGASRGIGRAAALALSERGAQVVAMARSRDALEGLEEEPIVKRPPVETSQRAPWHAPICSHDANADAVCHGRSRDIAAADLCSLGGLGSGSISTVGLIGSRKDSS